MKKEGSGSQAAPISIGALASSPFMSTWFSNRSSDRVTQRTSMLESTSELLICFRNTWNWSRDGAHWQGCWPGTTDLLPQLHYSADGTHCVSDLLRYCNSRSSRPNSLRVWLEAGN